MKQVESSLNLDLDLSLPCLLRPCYSNLLNSLLVLLEPSGTSSCQSEGFQNSSDCPSLLQQHSGTVEISLS
jgi:hypothetical protein